MTSTSHICYCSASHPSSTSTPATLGEVSITTKSKAVAKADEPSTDLAVASDLEALLAQQEEEFGDDLLTVPLLKVGQALTKEVEAGEAEAGEFINSLTGQGVGNAIGFIVAYYQTGRFAADQDSGKSYVAFGKTIPEQWEDLVGKEFVGTSFDEYPEAEEAFKRAVNAGDREWGRGPLVSTTHNFTGYAITESIDDEDEALIPVRLSLKRADTPAAKKFISLKKMLRLKAFWDVVYDLSTTREQSKQGKNFHKVQVKAGRKTTDEERMAAVALAQDVAAQRVQAVGEDGDAKREKPADNGGLGV